jgi:hypothetical protein
MALHLTFPEEVIEGMLVTLTASPPSDQGRYRYTFVFPNGTQEVTADSGVPGVIEWNTAGVAPGAYSIQVHAELEKGKAPAGAHKDSAEVYVAIRPRPVSAADLQNLVGPTSELATSLRQDLDVTMTGLASAVSSVAAAVNDVGGKLPTAGQSVPVALQRPEIMNEELRGLSAFFAAIRNRTTAIGFQSYAAFINRLFCEGNDKGGATCAPLGIGDRSAQDYGAPSIDAQRLELEARPTIYGVDSYSLLKVATQAFLVFEAGLAVTAPRSSLSGEPDPAQIPALEAEESARLEESVTLAQIRTRLSQYLQPSGGNLPYLDRIVDALLGADPALRAQKLPWCNGILRRRFSCPSMLELIWSYWHEEGMLVQTMSAISLRFQNRRSAPGRDPLAHLELDPLRPLNNLLWGYVQDEWQRLSLPRRAYEYDHHYGLTLYGRAVPKLQSADSRSKFLEAFHNLLHRAAAFFQEDADTTVIADAFPLLNALREVHLLLAEGAHNQFGDLVWTARAEMLTQQWLLARTEMREFLRGRAMVPYLEPWMGHVDTMKKLQGWNPVTVSDFHVLAIYGEQILLSIRYHDWIEVNDHNHAKLWARYWKPEIQRYIHSYRAVTGVDLTTEPVDASPPWVHLRSRLGEERRRRFAH